jgi:hypothetical protein
MLGNSLVAAQLAASQEGLNSMELVSYVMQHLKFDEVVYLTCPLCVHTPFLSCDLTLGNIIG